MSGHRPSRIAHDLVIQRAIRALPQLPAVFTAKQLKRVMPDRSPDQCRRLMDVLVSRGYCRRSSKQAIEATNTDAPTTLSDRILSLFTSTDTLTVAHAVPCVGADHKAAARTLERMADLGLLSRTKEPVPQPPHWRLVYRLAKPIPRASVAVPIGCRDPHCACPLAESDYDVRHGRLVRTICRRHETHDLEAVPCLR